MSTGDWDERYASHDDGLWSGRANGAMVTELSGSSSSRALDVGCGEGADAIWLARAVGTEGLPVLPERLG